MTSVGNRLGADPRPRFFPVADAGRYGFRPPAGRRDLAVRAYVRSLGGAQKEAVVASSAADGAWRLTSDEGPSLDGHAEAPVPLAFLTAGLVASYAAEVLALAEQRHIDCGGLRLTLDNFYTREGSALRGTMVGLAFDPTVHVELPAAVAPDRLLDLCADAVQASPVNGLVRGAQPSLFTLTANGAPVAVPERGPLDVAAELDQVARYDDLREEPPAAGEPLIRRLPDDAVASDRQAEAGSGLRDEGPRRRLNIRGVCSVRADGMKVIDVCNAHRGGAEFRFLSEEPARGRAGRAPDAATLVSAGIAFCFMTQLGRYAQIRKRPLQGYRVVQDTHFSFSDPTAGGRRRGVADPVEAHVFVDTAEGSEFARTLLRMGEQTCYLHSLCRTALRTEVTCSTADSASPRAADRQ